VGSLNVLNYFTTLGDRGADTAQELERQRAKLVSAVLGLDADVLGLMEIENTPSALDDFVASVNAASGYAMYQKAPDPAFTGTDSIRTALIYKPERVQAIGPGRSSSDEVFSRPPIAQEFSYAGNRFSVVVNHFKSKGSCPADSRDPNAEYGQGCWNVLRVEQAEALLDYIAELQALAGDPDVVVLGDLNSYLGEDPILHLEAGGLNNQILSVPEQQRYSYVFAGEAGVLDYALTTPSLSTSGASIWHINADEPRILDYNQEFNPPALYHPDQYRSSDHDPVLLGLALPADPAQLLRDFIAEFESLATLKLLDRAPVLLRARLALTLLRFEDRSTRLDRLDPAAVALAKKALQDAAKQVQQLAQRRKLSPELALHFQEQLQEIVSLL
jgi:predicted extracellular nuclease